MPLEERLDRLPGASALRPEQQLTATDRVGEAFALGLALGIVQRAPDRLPKRIQIVRTREAQIETGGVHETEV